MATGPIIRPTLRTPRRKCLGCGYPIIIASPPECPECGREYNPADPTTTGSIAPEDRTTEYRLGMMPGIASVPVSFMIFYSIQYAIMGWWHDTTTWFWWKESRRRHGSWWELSQLGNWLWIVQILVLLLLSILLGVLISRLTIRRQYRPARS